MKNTFFLLAFLIMSISSFAGTITSTGSGNWSTTSTWNTGKLPASTDTVVIITNNNVTIDVSSVVAGIRVLGQLTFDPTKSVTLQSSQNIIVNGSLTAKPNDYNITHLIQFIGINETKMVGGGMDPIATDVGLWVMGMGQLNLEGSYKKPFINAVGAITAGVTSVSLVDMPDGWKANDELTITPTTNGSKTFDETTIQSITINSNGKVVNLNKAVATAHPQINGTWTAEIINLTRNVRIEGTANGRTHVFIRSMMPQHVLNTQLRYIGPRKQQSGDAATEFLLGRYGFHFHHCMDGSVGTLIDGCVVRDAGSHSFVPHMSNGITMSHNVAYNVLETAFWWDLPDPTHNTKWIGNIVAGVNFIDRSIGIDTEGTPTFGTNGFILGIGDDNTCDSNVVVGQYGLETTNSAYDWEETDKQSTWQFVGNVAHNCNSGIRSWQNNEKAHVLENTTIYNCNIGVFHGAYGNNYTYNGGYLYNNIFEDHASSADNGVKILNMTLDGANTQTFPFKLIGGPGNGLKPIFMQNCTIKNGTQGAILDSTYQGKKSLDIVQSNIIGDIKFSTNSVTSEVIRIQPVTGQSTQVKKTGTTNIAAFAPTIWGIGSGLKAEYFDNVSLTVPSVVTRTEPVIIFKEWTDLNALPGDVTGVHHLITSDKYSVRFTGFIEPQFTETYTFKVDFGGGVRLYVDNKLIINKWFEAYPNTYTATAIALTAGKRVPIKLEYFNDDNNTQLLLKWQSTSLKLEVVPQSQLYPELPNTTPNQAPIANAGQDIVVQLPTTTVMVNGSLSTDQDGSIASYKWEKVSGPTSFSITNPNSSSTSISNLVAGTYVFRLTVTDNNGVTSTDSVTITVTSVNLAPSADAGQGQTINLVINLIGNGNDQDGTIISYKWEQASGPTCIIANPFAQNTTVSNLQIGTYVFKLTVTDNQGATGTATVTYIIQ
jgi:hypothetical protein